MANKFNPFPANIKKVGIFAPAKRVDSAELQLGLDKLVSLGLQCCETISSNEAKRYFAGTEEERIRNIQLLLDDQDIDLLLAARGGFGSAKILELFDWTALKRRNIPVLGYSDLTAFHLAAVKNGCRKQIFAPMLCSDWLKEENEAYHQTMQSLSNCLQGNENLLPSWHQAEIVQPGKAAGQLLPANLSVLCSLIGSRFLPDFQDNILVLEDINTPAHAVERYLHQLYLCGILQQLSGLIFAQFTNCEDDEFLGDIFAEYAQWVKGPVLKNFAFGHTMPTMSLPCGKMVLLEAEKNEQISLKLDSRELFEAKIFSTKGQDMPYRLLSPEKIEYGKKYPLVLMLHGSGGRGTDNISHMRHIAATFCEEEVRKKYSCFVVFPQCPEENRWVEQPWGPRHFVQPLEISRSLATALELHDELIKTLPIDTNRLYVMGLSMGGYATWDIIARENERFAAAIPICGGADMRNVEKYCKIPLWVFHGSEDRVVPPELSRSICKAINDAGGNCRYTEYQGEEHFSWIPAMKEKELLPWLFEQELGNRE